MRERIVTSRWDQFSTNTPLSRTERRYLRTTRRPDPSIFAQPASPRLVTQSKPKAVQGEVVTARLRCSTCGRKAGELVKNVRQFMCVRCVMPVLLVLVACAANACSPAPTAPTQTPMQTIASNPVTPAPMAQPILCDVSTVQPRTPECLLSFHNISAVMEDDPTSVWWVCETQPRVYTTPDGRTEQLFDHYISRNPCPEIPIQ